MPHYAALPPELHHVILSHLSLPDAQSMRLALPNAAHAAHVRARVARLRPLRDAWVRAAQPPLRAYANPPSLRSHAARRAASVDHFCSLSVLPLASAGLRSLDAIAELPALRVLDVSRNALTTIPDELAACRAIRVLHLGDNCLHQFPLVVLSLPRLTTLLLHRNRIGSLPLDWSSLPCLYRLGLYNCAITGDLPEQLCRVLGTQTEHHRCRSANLQGNRFDRHAVQALFHRFPRLASAVII